MQATAVAIAVRDYMGMKFDKKELSALPKELLAGIDQLLKPKEGKTAKKTSTASRTTRTKTG